LGFPSKKDPEDEEAYPHGQKIHKYEDFEIGNL
jgi:hypothetical protein